MTATLPYLCVSECKDDVSNSAKGSEIRNKQ